MFNFGWGELVVIGIVALIAIGPKELPTVLRTLGQWMGKVRRMANEFQGQFQEALREAEFGDLKKHADDISSSVSELGQIDPIGDIQKDVERTFEETPPAEAVAVATTENAAAPAASPTLPEVEVPPPAPPAAITSEEISAAVEPPPAEKAGSGA